LEEAAAGAVRIPGAGAGAGATLVVVKAAPGEAASREVCRTAVLGVPEAQHPRTKLRIHHRYAGTSAHARLLALRSGPTDSLVVLLPTEELLSRSFGWHSWFLATVGCCCSVQHGQQQQQQQRDARLSTSSRKQQWIGAEIPKMAPEFVERHDGSKFAFSLGSVSKRTILWHLQIREETMDCGMNLFFLLLLYYDIGLQQKKVFVPFCFLVGEVLRRCPNDTSIRCQTEWSCAVVGWLVG